jgi:hypothetical protein
MAQILAALMTALPR